ncbi:hypothetical protein [Kitasatospora sp. NPDC059571]|uniref:hypothetical protein n=1 Tax=Kitasatospora sp. NPDC059571 TaxID=3346871 RepID=UPI0036A4BE72
MIELWPVVPDGERWQWTLEPFVAVGPLRFGMSPAEAADALRQATAEAEPHRHYHPAPCSLRDSEDGRYLDFGLRLYYGQGRLAAVIVNALCGPQVLVDGAALVARVPSAVERWMLDRAAAHEPDGEVVYMGGGLVCSESLGVVINVQRAGDRLITRPMFLSAEALDGGSYFLPEDLWEIER